MLKKVFTCHPERSEGSHVFEKARFFAALRMTIKVKRFMTHYTNVSASGRINAGKSESAFCNGQCSSLMVDAALFV
jgi:hypothetical protein